MLVLEEANSLAASVSSRSLTRALTFCMYTKRDECVLDSCDDGESQISLEFSVRVIHVPVSTTVETLTSRKLGSVR